MRPADRWMDREGGGQHTPTHKPVPLCSRGLYHITAAAFWRNPSTLYMLVVRSFILIAAAVRRLFALPCSDFTLGCWAPRHGDQISFKIQRRALKQGTSDCPQLRPASGRTSCSFNTNIHTRGETLEELNFSGGLKLLGYSISNLQ